MKAKTVRPSRQSSWVVAIACGLASLALSAVLLWIAMPLAYPEGSERLGSAEPVRLERRDFRSVPAMSLARDVHEQLGFMPRPRDFILQSFPAVSAERYPMVQLRAEPVSPPAEAYLFWRSSEAPGALGFAPLDKFSAGITWKTLAVDPLWTGEITEIAIAAFGPGSSAFELREVSLPGVTRSAMMEFWWWEWTRVKPWLQSSTNRYPGVRSSTALHPGAAFMAWAALALLIFLLAAFALGLAGRAFYVTSLLILFLPWLGLDRLWQHQLEQQLEITAERFGGLTQEQKGDREDDRFLQDYAAHLKELLPESDEPRVFILQDSRGHDYRRLRLQFHLLPYNVYNYGKNLLPPGKMRAGDYVLVIHDNPELEFEPDRGVLGDEAHAWLVTRVDQTRFGDLYRLESTAHSARPTDSAASP